MSISADDFSQIIKQKLEASHVDVTDTSGGCGQSFEVVIVSSLFQGKATLARHRLVNEVLKDEISKIHAFSQKTFTSDEWVKKSIGN